MNQATRCCAVFTYFCRLTGKRFILAFSGRTAHRPFETPFGSHITMSALRVASDGSPLPQLVMATQDQTEWGLIFTQRPRAPAAAPPFSSGSRPQIAARIPRAYTRRSHPAVRSPREASREVRGRCHVQAVTALQANRSRRTASPRGRLPFARRCRPHQLLRMH